MLLPIHSLALLPTLFTSIAQAVHPVEVRGQDFVDTVTNKRVMVIGVDYQPGGQASYKPQQKQDVLSDADVCLRDATLMQRLGVNTIRAYNVDPTLDHSACASIFNTAGIYMIIDVNSPLQGESINRAAPWTSYNKDYLSRVFRVVENFKNFPNTLGFFAANEVMNDLSTAEYNPQYIRAVQRDLKNYIAKHAPRKIPVGYSAADVREILHDTWAYMQCNRDDDNSSSDFFGLNSYSWCGQATYQTSGYVDLVNMFNQSAIPVFYSEYGCNKVQPRTFTEVQALYGPNMTSLSGGLVYEYSQEEQDYGLVIINANGSISLRVDYDNLQVQYNQLDTNLIQSTNPASTNIKPPTCASSLITAENFSKNFSIPAVCPDCQAIIDNGVSNTTIGRIVDVTNTKPKQQVYGSNGALVQGLELRKLSNDGVNTPGGQTPTPSGTSSPSPSPSKKGAAHRLTITAAAWVWIFAIMAFLLS